MVVVIVIWIFQQAFTSKPLPRISGLKYTDHTLHTREILFLFWDHIFWNILAGLLFQYHWLENAKLNHHLSILGSYFLNKYALGARRQEKNIFWNKFVHVCDRMNT